MVAALMGAVSIMFVTFAGFGPREAAASRATFTLPQVPADASDVALPRECDADRNITSSCTY
jgi:hypothetical protein